nr:hypothetical protein [Pandoraea nosoerga]
MFALRLVVQRERPAVVDQTSITRLPGHDCAHFVGALDRQLGSVQKADVLPGTQYGVGYRVRFDAEPFERAQVTAHGRERVYGALLHFRHALHRKIAVRSRHLRQRRRCGGKRAGHQGEQRTVAGQSSANAS